MIALVSSTFFPGWPTATAPSAFFYFMLCLGAPLLVGLVVIGLGIGLGRKKQLAEDERRAGIYEVAPVHTPQRALVTDETR